MDLIAKMTVGSALALGAVSASAAIGTPTTGSSDAILFGEVLNGSNVVASYAGDTGISITSLANGTNTKRSALSGDANLSALFAADASGDTLYWAVEGGQFQGNGTAGTYVKVPGYAQFVTTTFNNSLAQLSAKTTTNLSAWASGLNTEMTAINTNLNGNNSVEGPSAATAGIWDYNVPSDISGWYSNGPLTGNTALSANLYYVTGGGTTISKVSYQNVDTLTLSANGLQVSNGSTPADSYDISTRKLTIPTLDIGGATYSNVVVTVEGIVSGPSGSSPNGSTDTYNPTSGDLTVQAVTVGSGTYYNVVVKLTGLDAIGSVSGADSFSGGQLTISNVQVGSTVYTDVVVTVAGIVSLAGDMPEAALDAYSFSNNELSIPAVTYANTVYTNVVIKVGSIVHVGGSHPAAAAAFMQDGVIPNGEGTPEYVDHGGEIFAVPRAR